jgi:Rrf2 family transcriptional regulator, nitric oxide-sensitive transcriptional repressor
VRLTVYTDFSLRLLMYLAVKEGGLATIAEVAESYGISRNHLMKVAHQLGLAGYVATVRGKNGGLRLARPAETVILGDVVRRTEPDLALVPCFHPVDAPCAIWPKCVLREAMQNALEAFLKTLDGYTLADLARPASQLRVLLSIAPSDRLPRTPGQRALRLS